MLQELFILKRRKRRAPVQGFHARIFSGKSHPGPNLGLATLPIGSPDSADAEREKRSQRLGEIVRRMVPRLNAQMVSGGASRDLD